MVEGDEFFLVAGVVLVVGFDEIRNVLVGDKGVSYGAEELDDWGV